MTKFHIFFIYSTHKVGQRNEREREKNIYDTQKQFSQFSLKPVCLRLLRSRFSAFLLYPSTYKGGCRCEIFIQQEMSQAFNPLPPTAVTIATQDIQIPFMNSSSVSCLCRDRLCIMFLIDPFGVVAHNEGRLWYEPQSSDYHANIAF